MSKQCLPPVLTVGIGWLPVLGNRIPRRNADRHAGQEVAAGTVPNRVKPSSGVFEVSSFHMFAGVIAQQDLPSVHHQSSIMYQCMYGA